MCANFAGPGTNISARLARGDKPVNQSDAYAMQHDVDYMNIGRAKKQGKIDAREARHMVRDSDNRLMSQTGLKI